MKEESKNLEIEKKLKVISDEWKEMNCVKKNIFQSYFKDEMDGENKRIRIIPDDNRAIITIKTYLYTSHDVPVRKEVEYDIDFQRGLDIILKSDKIINKERYTTPFNKFLFEIDVFKNLENPLTVVEIEMDESEIPIFNLLILPKWIGQDISSDDKYSNFYLKDKVDTSIPVKEYLLSLKRQPTKTIQIK